MSKNKELKLVENNKKNNISQIHLEYFQNYKIV